LPDALRNISQFPRSAITKKLATQSGNKSYALEKLTRYSKNMTRTLRQHKQFKSNQKAIAFDLFFFPGTGKTYKILRFHSVRDYIQTIKTILYSIIIEMKMR